MIVVLDASDCMFGGVAFEVVWGGCWGEPADSTGCEESAAGVDVQTEALLVWAHQELAQGLEMEGESVGRMI